MTDLDPSFFEQASEEYFMKRAELLKHLTFRYQALNPEMESDIETAHDYSDLDFDVKIGDTPENVRELADTLNWREKFSYKELVREIQNKISWETGSLMVLKENYDLGEDVEQQITDAFSYVVDVFHKDYHREDAETPVEKDLMGEDGDYLVFDGELMPLPRQIEMSYNSVMGEDEVAENFDSAVKSSIPLENFYSD